MQKGPLIGQGFSADVFAWGDEQALKLFHDNTLDEEVQHEAEVTELVYKLGLAVPRVDEVIKLDDRYGIIYERIEGDSMLDVFAQNPWKLFQLTRQFVQLQISMHSIACSELPSLHNRIEGAIADVPELTGDVKSKLIDALHCLPDGDMICHGDYHPDNVIISARGPITIDWLTVAQGNPLADVARTLLLLRSASLPAGTGRFEGQLMQMARRLFRRLYLREYLKYQPASREQVEAWVPLQAVVRLTEEIPGEKEWLLTLIENWARGHSE